MIKLADLAPGTRYFAVYSASGVCIGRYATETEAQHAVDRDPDRRDYRVHTR